MSSRALQTLEAQAVPCERGGTVLGTCQFNLLPKLVARGDAVSIDAGRLKILTASGLPVPQDWLSRHSEALIREILEAVGVEAYRYDTYNTGRYEIGFKGKRAPGVCLQFSGVVTGVPGYAIFNCDLDYARGKNKGRPLPAKQFRVTKRFNFYKFWLRAGLKIPPRLGSFHDYMGNLRDILFSGISRNERLDGGTLSPLLVRSDWIQRKLFPDNHHTQSGQRPDNSRTNMPYNDSPEPLNPQGLEANQTTGVTNHGNKVVRDTEERVRQYTDDNDIRLQSIEEWLYHYGEPDAHEVRQH